MARINCSVKIIFILSFVVILECTQLGGGIGEYSDVTCKTPFPSESFEIVAVRPDKIFTPNGDGWNDYLEIRYDNPYDALVSGKIYDIKGRLVANMKKDENEEIPRLIWNGNDLDNEPVTGGVYIYRIEVSGPENKVIRGIIILVR